MLFKLCFVVTLINSGPTIMLFDCSSSLTNLRLVFSVPIYSKGLPSLTAGQLVSTLLCNAMYKMPYVCKQPVKIKKYGITREFTVQALKSRRVHSSLPSALRSSDCREHRMNTQNPAKFLCSTFVSLCQYCQKYSCHTSVFRCFLILRKTNMFHNKKKEQP